MTIAPVVPEWRPERDGLTRDHAQAPRIDASKRRSGLDLAIAALMHRSAPGIRGARLTANNGGITVRSGYSPRMELGGA